MSARAFAKIVKDIDPRKFEELRKRLSAGKHQVNVGFPGGQDHKDSDLSVAQIAAIHEFGAPSVGIPERPFLRTSIDKNRPRYKALNRQTLAGVVRGAGTVEQALGLLGEAAKADVQKEIASGAFAPLKASTIRRKKSSKPLIDSGQLRQSVAWEIEK